MKARQALSLAIGEAGKLGGPLNGSFSMPQKDEGRFVRMIWEALKVRCCSDTVNKLLLLHHCEIGRTAFFAAYRRQRERDSAYLPACPSALLCCLCYSEHVALMLTCNLGQNALVHALRWSANRLHPEPSRRSTQRRDWFK